MSKESSTVVEDVTVEEFERDPRRVLEGLESEQKSYRITRGGKPFGAVVPVALQRRLEELERGRQRARESVVSLLDRLAGGRPIPTAEEEDEAEALAAEAVRAVRTERYKKGEQLIDPRE